MKEKFSIRPKITGSHTLILIGIGFSLVYWVLESVRDTFVFHRGPLVQRIFLPDPMGFYMRLLVVCIIMLFSVQAQSARNRTESKQDEKPSSWRMYSIILSGFAFGAFYWLLEAFRDAFIFDRGGLWERIVSPDPMFIWMRLLAICIIVLFSIYAQSLVNARKVAEWALQKKTGDLEKSVRERTADLTRSNLLLRQEIMERQQRERELRIMESAIDSSINAISMVDLDGRVTYINPAFAGLWKTDADEAVGQKAVDFWADKQKAAGILRQLVDGKSWIGELDALARDGTVFPVQVSMNVVQDHGGKPMCMMGSFLDISQRRAAEAEKESMQAQLIQAQKMEAVGVLTGGIAHDFNNFLTAIQVSCDLAMMQVNEGAPLYNDLNAIHNLTSKAADLIRQLLLFSRKHHMEFVQLDLNKAIDGLGRMLDHLIGEDITITRELDPKIHPIKADRGTLEQVIMNLCINARDAMPNGGNLLIHTENLTLDKDGIERVPGAVPGEYVRLTVRDTGVGMSDEIIKQIFDPFFTTKKAGKGTGLGLSVVYGIVKQHKGWIHVTSQAGKGSVFQIYLPVLPGETDKENNMDFRKAGDEPKDQRILFIEDEEKIRECTARGLTQKGFKVFCAGTAREAEDLFDAQGGDFQMVVSDVVLPDQNGVDLVEKFLKIRPELKILLSSGYTDHKSMWPAIQEKGYNFLVKPYTLMDLINAINGAIHA